MMLCWSRVAVGLLLPEGDATPLGLSIVVPDPMPQPEWSGEQFATSAWAGDAERWRERQMAPSDDWSKGLDSVFTDDGGSPGGDTTLHKPWTEFKGPHDGSYWEMVCNGSNSTIVQALKGPQPPPMHDWHVKHNVTCGASHQMPGEYATGEEAVGACGNECASVADVGCTGTRFVRCKLGSIDVDDLTNGTCLRLRMPGHRPPEGKPSKPIYQDFWTRFCTQGGIAFRKLFRNRVCATGKVLPEAWSEGRCAELTAADAACSDIFDFDARVNSTPECRCVPLGTACDAAAPTTVDESKNVFIRRYIQPGNASTVAEGSSDAVTTTQPPSE